jgi:hypothetical protein
MALAVTLLGGLLLVLRGERRTIPAAGGGADTVLHAMEAILDRQGLGAALDSLATKPGATARLARGQ